MLGSIWVTVISTHDLVRGRPKTGRTERRADISTHDLVRGRPHPDLISYHFFTFQLTTSWEANVLAVESAHCPDCISTHDLVRGRRLVRYMRVRSISYFNSRPRERPTRLGSGGYIRGWNFNSRPRERPTSFPNLWSWSSRYFNSRPRERPTRTSWILPAISSYFNSRPRERPTLWFFHAPCNTYISTHDLVRGRRII